MSFTRADRRTSENWVWNINTLDWDQMTQPSTGGGGGGDASAANQNTEIAYLTVIANNTGAITQGAAGISPWLVKFPPSQTGSASFTALGQTLTFTLAGEQTLIYSVSGSGSAELDVSGSINGGTTYYTIPVYDAAYDRHFVGIGQVDVDDGVNLTYNSIFIVNVAGLDHVRISDLNHGSGTVSINAAVSTATSSIYIGNTVRAKVVNSAVAPLYVNNTGTLPLTTVSIKAEVSGTGTPTIVTPTSGKSLRIYYLSYSPTVAAELYFLFGATTDPQILKNSLTAGSIVAKDFGDARYIQGNSNEALKLNCVGSGDYFVYVNVFYTEVD